MDDSKSQPGKVARRRDVARTIVPDEAAVMPLLMYQRLMTERARSGARPHIEAAETSIASSFTAARQGAMVQHAGDSADAAAYRDAVSKLLTVVDGTHPKVGSVLEAAMSAADNREKSLIFCERNRTISSLQEEIEKRWMNGLLARWQRMYPDADMEAVFGAGSRDERRVGTFQRWATRFTRGQDELSVALRESYPHTLFVRPDEPELRQDLWHDTSALIGPGERSAENTTCEGHGRRPARLETRRALHRRSGRQVVRKTGRRCPRPLRGTSSAASRPEIPLSRV
jgi:hypothetical protein